MRYDIELDVELAQREIVGRELRSENAVIDERAAATATPLEFTLAA